MKRLRGALVAIVAVFALAGCAPGSGTVVGKDFDPFENCTWRDPKTNLCKVALGAYELKVSSGSQSGWVEVSKREYDTYKIGDQYPHPQ